MFGKLPWKMLLVCALAAAVLLPGDRADASIPAADYTLEDPVPELYSYFGRSVEAGDVNGDGNDDGLVGAPRSDAGGGDPREGQVFVFLGGDPFAAAADFTLQDPSPITGLDGSFGGAVTAGDVNGDGKDDVVGGSPG